MTSENTISRKQNFPQGTPALAPFRLDLSEGLFIGLRIISGRHLVREPVQYLRHIVWGNRHKSEPTTL
jgi:hypothetical protein